MKTETRRDGTVQLADWWEDLIWPRVMSAAALGVRPSRIGLAFFGLVAGLVVVALGALLDEWVGKTSMPTPWRALMSGDGPWTPVWRLVVEYPVECAAARPFTTALMVLVALPIELIVFGAISRLVALEFSRGEFATWTEGLAFSVARVKSLVGAVAGPLALVWFVALVLAGGGWLFLNWPYVNVVGSVLYGLALIMAMGAGLVAIAFLVGGSLLVPAVVCDGADAIDAIQRAYAYTLDRPVRLLMYYVLAALGLFFVVVVMTLILGTGVGIAYAGVGQWLGERGQDMLFYGTMSALPGTPPMEPPPEGSWGAGAWMIRLWTMLPVYLLLASVASCAIAAKTVVYLGIRRVCDGQDTGELWMPGLIEGSMSAALRGRAEVADVKPTGLPIPEASDDP